MYLDAEFAVADLRPLEGREKRLLPFLVPLHTKNLTLQVMNQQPAPYYRSVGVLDSWKTTGPSYFKAPHAVKIPVFQEHAISLQGSGSPVTIHRYNRVRRYFTSAYYGVQNKFRLGIGFQLGGATCMPADKVAFEVLKFFFSLPVKVYGGKKEITVGELDDWLADVVHRGTFFEIASGPSVSGPLSGRTPSQDDGKVMPAGITVVWECKADELESFPREAVRSYENEQLELFVYDYRLKDLRKTARIYGIRKKADCDATYLRNFRRCLMEERTACLCLDRLIDRIGLTNWRQKSYIDELAEAKMARDEAGFGIFTSEMIYNRERIRQIAEQILLLKQIDDGAVGWEQG